MLNEVYNDKIVLFKVYESSIIEGILKQIYSLKASKEVKNDKASKEIFIGFNII